VRATSSRSPKRPPKRPDPDSVTAAGEVLMRDSLAIPALTRPRRSQLDNTPFTSP
jgi:hypothetical protein